MGESSIRHSQVRVTEIYASVQGESTHVGKPCVFLRTSRCNLRCTWCDSAFTFSGGTLRGLDEVVEEATGFGIHTIEVTGGEPLLQPSVIPLMERLLERGHEVLLETSGSISIEKVPDGVHIICDWKCPDSGEMDKNFAGNLKLLRAKDELKFVIASRKDYEWARQVVQDHDLPCVVLFGVAWDLLPQRDLVDWIVEDKLNVRFQMQAHKYIWPSDARGV